MVIHNPVLAIIYVFFFFLNMTWNSQYNCTSIGQANKEKRNNSHIDEMLTCGYVRASQLNITKFDLAIYYTTAKMNITVVSKFTSV